MLAYNCGTGIGGRDGGAFEGRVSDGICGAGGGGERALTVETRRAACGGIGVFGAGLRAGAATGVAGCADTRRSMRLSVFAAGGLSAWGFSACSLAISRVICSWPAASCATASRKAARSLVSICWRSAEAAPSAFAAVVSGCAIVANGRAQG